MRALLQDFLLSYCPLSVRRVQRPESLHRTLCSATWGGLAQMLLAGFALIIRLKSYLILRTHQLASQAAGSNETGQTILLIVFLFEYLLEPFSLLLVYLAVEGAVRFAGGAITGEIIPSLVVSLFFKSTDLIRRMNVRREEKKLPSDLLEYLPEGRVRISPARAKARWNESISIGLHGQWFEVEDGRPGTPPYPVIYILRPVSPGKILRGYEEYDAAAVLIATTAETK